MFAKFTFRTLAQNVKFENTVPKCFLVVANRPSTESREVAQGLVVDFDVDGNIVGIDIDHASKKLDLKTLETESLPTIHVKVA